MKILITAFLLISFSVWAKDKSVKTISKDVEPFAKYRQPSQILPLDEQTEKYLKASSLANQVVEDDSDQKEFHRKAFVAYQKISPMISLKKVDSLFYIYDCLFMIEEGFYLKYSNLPKDKLKKTRKIVIESFE
jgi:hypothetical protein